MLHLHTHDIGEPCVAGLMLWGSLRRASVFCLPLNAETPPLRYERVALGFVYLVPASQLLPFATYERESTPRPFCVPLRLAVFFFAAETISILFVPIKKLYHSSSVLAIQQLVDGWIISHSVADGSSAAPQVQLRMSEFPHSEYEENGFWADVSP